MDPIETDPLLCVNEIAFTHIDGTLQYYTWMKNRKLTMSIKEYEVDIKSNKTTTALARLH